MISMIPIITIRQKEEIEKIKKHSKNEFEFALIKVLPIINGIKTFGDKSLFQFIKKYDCFEATKNNILVKKEEIKNAYKKTDKKIIDALKSAKDNIENYAKLQLPKEWFKEIKKGVKVGQLVRALERVGCYIPGGNFS